MSELGWLKKGSVKGWNITEQGLKLGGIQTEDQRSGIPYVRWPENITEVQSLVETVAQLKGKASEKRKLEESIEGDDGFREKFEAKHRTTDGHFVRSKAEMLIDNWLYMAEIVHAYERKLPIEESVYSDFYIPTGKVYIEYWGLENNPKYLERKQKKIELYQKYGFNLIQLEDKDVQNLDDILPGSCSSMASKLTSQDSTRPSFFVALSVILSSMTPGLLLLEANTEATDLELDSGCSNCAWRRTSGPLRSSKIHRDGPGASPDTGPSGSATGLPEESPHCNQSADGSFIFVITLFRIFYLLRETGI